MDLTALLKDRFGFPGFRPGQEEIVQHVVDGNDCMVIMPTGAGKSLCFQVPSLARGGTALVVSPLIALMKDQVDGLNAKGIRATFINSSLSSEERKHRIRLLREGHWEMVYVAPERFSPWFIDQVRACRIGLLAIDEAHCLSQWGHDFRPDYLRLGTVREKLGRPVTMALTATATPQVQDDIARVLGIDVADRFIRGFDRENLKLEVMEVVGDRAKAEVLPDLVRGKTALVYAATRKNVERAARALREAGVPAGIYHAGLTPSDRTLVQEAFMDGRIPVVVATNAFGMGVDKEDVRLIVHWSIPGTVEAYYQEIGRAGRDGRDSRVVLMYSPQDRRIQDFFINSSYPPAAFVHNIYNRILEERTNPIFITRETLAEALPEDSANERTASSCLYVLQREGWIRRIHPADRPARILARTDPPAAIPRGIRGKVLDHLRRMMEAFPGDALEIQVDLMARTLELEREQLVAALQGLEDRGYIVYRPPERIGGVELLRPPDLPLDLDESVISERRQREFEKLDLMIEYTRAVCRRRYLMEYFGQTPEYERCGTCDACRGGVPERKSPRPLTADQEVVVRKALACLARMNGAWSPTLVAKVLTGSKDQTIQSFGFNRLSTYGILSDWTQPQILDLLSELVRAGAMKKTHVTREVSGRERTYAEISMTHLGAEVMMQKSAGFKMVFPDKNRGRGGSSSSKRSRGSKRSARASHSEVSPGPVSHRLLQELKDVRRNLAEDANVPQYVVASNRTLEEMASRKPTTPQDLLDIHGMGPARMKRYGQPFLDTLQGWRE
jgi:ATP-dependent DNA helicase RecQ